MTVKREARFGGRNALVAAQQKLMLEVSFQRGDVLAQSGLGDPQGVGGARHAAGIDDRNEALEFLEVDAQVAAIPLVVANTGTSVLGREGTL